MTLNTYRPFTAAEGASHGIQRADLISRKYKRLHWGCYIRAEVPVTHRVMVEAAMKVVPAAQFASHHSAARLYGLPVPDTSTVHLGTRADRRTKRTLVRLHRYLLAEPELAPLGADLLATSLPQTFHDLSHELGLIEGVVLDDALLRESGNTAEWLTNWLAARVGHSSLVAQRAARLLSPLAESPRESRLRMFVRLCGFPPVDEQIVVTTRSGDRRIDMGWREFKLGIEYDGRHHIEREHQWRHDTGRREDLESLGWRLVIVTNADLFDTPEQLARRILTVSVERGMPQTRLRDDWRHYFPGRRAA